MQSAVIVGAGYVTVTLGGLASSATREAATMPLRDGCVPPGAARERAQPVPATLLRRSSSTVSRHRP